MPQEATIPDATERRRSLAAVGGLGVTQIVGWGTTFSPLAIFGTTLERDLYMSREVVFAGITMMLLVSALVAPYAGRHVDRRGARPVMVAGSLLVSLAMVLMSFAQGVISYMLAWVVIGIAMPMMLSNAALAGIVQVVGPNARRAITGLMLMSGLTGTVFLPLNAWLLGTIGWRGAYLVFAAMHLLICLPIHAIVLRRTAETGGPAQRGNAPIEGLLAPENRKAAFVMLAIWSCTEGLITWGLYMQIVDVLKGLGLSGAAAIGVWAMVGPAQAAARFVDLVSGGRTPILTTALASAVLTTISFFLILPFGASVLTAAAFSICLGLGHGLFAIARNTLPLVLFGAREYGSYMGLLMVPQNIVNAAAPVLFAAALSRFDPLAPLWLAGVAALTGLISVYFMVRACKVAGPR